MQADGRDRGRRSVQPSTSGRLSLSFRESFSCQLCGIGHRQSADEALARVDRRPAVDEAAVPQERNVFRGPECDHVGGGGPPERRPRDRGLPRPDERELARRRQVQVERTSACRTLTGRTRWARPFAARRLPGARALRHPRSAPPGAAPRRASSSPPGKDGPRAPSCAPRAARRRGSEEEPAPLVVGEELDGENGEATRLREPAQLAGRDVQLEEAARDVRVVVDEAAAPQLSSRHVRCSRPSGVDIGPRTNSAIPRAASTQSGRSSLHPASASAWSARPFQEAIALSSRAGCGRASRTSRRRRASSSESSPRRTDRPCSNGSSSSGRSTPRSLGLRPGEGKPLRAVGVGVLGRGEAAAVQAQLAEDVVERQLDDPPVTHLAGHGVGMEVGEREQRVVVEHLLEVRHEPALVHRVTVEAAADEILHAALGHRVEGVLDAQRARIAVEMHAQQELEHRGGRELRRAAEAALAARRRRPRATARPSSTASGEGLARRRERSAAA